MAGDPLANLNPGDPLPTRQATWNGILESARDYRNREAGRQGGNAREFGFPSASLVEIFYDQASTEVLAAHSVVRYGDPLLDPDTAELRPTVARRPAFAGETPNSANNQFAVTVEPIPGQTVGKAVCAGLAVVRINVTDEGHVRAVPIASESGYLASSITGVPIIWKPPGTGLLWCVIRIDETAGDYDSAAGSSSSGSGTSGSGGGTTAVGQFSFERYSYYCDEEGLHEVTETVTVELEIVNGEIITTTTVT